MKKYFYFAAALLTLASCANDDFIGEGGGENGQTIISLSSGTGTTTRVTSNTGTDVEKLDGQFKIYGVKSGSTAGSNLTDVFVNYVVWNGTANSTTSNTSGWEYVGAAGATGLGKGSISIATDHPQTIKYWDYSAADYRFVAGSPVASFTYTVNSGTIASATVEGLAGHINANTTGTAITTNPVYIAKPVIVVPDDYQKPVKFEFVRQQAMVRVGVYETIPGYDITEIHFYKTDGTKAETTSNIILKSATADYFVGGSAAKGTITYDWTNKTYSFAYTDGLTTSKDWYAGALTGVQAITSNEATVSKLYGTDSDMGTTGYFTVIPTPSATTAAPILVKCDYTLTSNDGRSTETIKVTGATAAIPAAYCKWAQNTSYTYIFKISDNTNGYTGATSRPEGLYPITFDAMAVATSDSQGTITTVSTPTFTTYQEGSVTDAGIEYAKDKEIYATVANDETGALNDLTTGGSAVGNVEVYKLTQARTEADLQVSGIFKTEITDNSTGKQTTTVGTGETVGTVTLVKDKYVSFKPASTGYYAIQYCTKAAEAAVLSSATTTSDATTILAAGTKYTTDEGTTILIADGTTALGSGVTYKTVTKDAVPAVYAYKVVYVSK